MRSSLYGTSQQWRDLFEEFEQADRLTYWEEFVVPAALRGYTPTECRQLAQAAESLHREPTDISDWIVLEIQAEHAHRRNTWVMWLVFAVGLLLVSVAVSQLLLAVTDAR
jgi:hypothetical protein